MFINVKHNSLSHKLKATSHTPENSKNYKMVRKLLQHSTYQKRYEIQTQLQLTANGDLHTPYSIASFGITGVTEQNIQSYEASLC